MKLPIDDKSEIEELDDDFCFLPKEIIPEPKLMHRKPMKKPTVEKTP